MGRFFKKNSHKCAVSGYPQRMLDLLVLCIMKPLKEMDEDYA